MKYRVYGTQEIVTAWTVDADSPDAAITKVQSGELTDEEENTIEIDDVYYNATGADLVIDKESLAISESLQRQSDYYRDQGGR